MARTLEARIPDAQFIIAKFEQDSGRMEIATKEDLRQIDRAELQETVNCVIKKNLAVRKYLIERNDAERKFDLARVPASEKKVRIVDIEGFDRTPCKDPHVENTSEIGSFAILKVEKSGKDRYRFVFKVV